MRTTAMVSLVGLLAIQSCEDAGGPPDGGPPDGSPGPAVSAAAQIRATTTGLEVDPDGFRVVVDGHEVGTVASNGMLVTLLDPGSHAITLIGLTPNCTIDGADSRTVAVKEDDMVPVVFAVVCTATSGVVSVVVDVSGPSGSAAFTAALDEARTWVVTPGEPSYLAGVSAGEHGTSLRTPSYCVLQTEAQRISVAVGEVVRDTVEVHFAATCDPSWDVTGIVRITAPTTGSIPEGTRYSVLHQHYGYWDLDGPMSNLGFLEPGGSLVVELEATSSGRDPYWNRFSLDHVPADCIVHDPSPASSLGFKIMPGDTLEVELAVTCDPDPWGYAQWGQRDQ